MSPADAGLPSRVPAAVKTVQDMERQVKLARKRWAEAQQRAKEREDRKRREVEYKPGDQVVLSTVCGHGAVKEVKAALCGAIHSS